MDERLAGLRDRIRELYGLDIDDAEMHFSTRNYAFVFPESPYMVRVNVGAEKSREQALGELLWVDDLKSFSDTICEPSPSLQGNLFEEFEEDGVPYRVSMFRTAKGNVRAAVDVEPIDLICVGDLLGRIHAAGKDALAEGLRFPLTNFEDKMDALVTGVKDKVAPEVYERMLEANERARRETPRDEAHYGIIHGDFHDRNYFMDGHNVWIFDFDDCSYGPFMYDIACIVIAWLRSGYGWPRPRREVLVDDVVPYFKIGYELHLPLPEDFWELLEVYVQEQLALAVGVLMSIDHIGAATTGLENARRSAIGHILADDWCASYDRLCEQRLGSGTVAAGAAEDEAVDELEDEYLRLSGTAGDVTVWFKERLDTNNAEAVGARLEGLVDGGATGLTLDGTDLVYLSSAGIRVVMRLLRKLGGVRLRHLSEGVREVLDVTGVLDLPGIVVED